MPKIITVLLPGRCVSFRHFMRWAVQLYVTVSVLSVVSISPTAAGNETVKLVSVPGSCQAPRTTRWSFYRVWIYHCGRLSEVNICLPSF